MQDKLETSEIVGLVIALIAFLYFGAHVVVALLQ